MIGEQETERLPGQHGLVHGRYLVWQRLNDRGVDGEYRVKKVCKADAVCFGHQAEKGAVAIETPGTALFYDIEARLVLSIE